MSVNRKLITLVLTLMCLPLFSACGEVIVGDPLGYLVDNNAENWPYADPENRICLGGLKAKVTTGDTLLFKSPVVMPDDPYYREVVKNPEGFGKGSPMTIEAWCYHEDSTLQGYIKYENTVTGGFQALGIDILGFKAINDCLKSTESTGEPPCILTTLFG